MAYLKDQTVGDLDKLLQQAKAPHTRFEPVWFLNLAFYLGDHWLFWNHGRLDRPKLDPWRLMLIDNRIQGIVRTELAKMTKQKPTWQVVPTTAADEDMQAARTGEKLLDFLWWHLSMRNKLMDVLLWSRVACAGFWKVCWDSAKGQKVNIVTDPQGQPVMHAETGAPMKPDDFGGELPEGLGQKTIATGDVHIEIVTPFELYPDPIAHEIEDAEWCIQTTVKSPEYVHAHFGVDMAPDTDVAPGVVEARMFSAYQLSGTSGYKGVKVNEYWCRPNSQHPNGRRAVWAKGKILLQEDNPYKSLPYVMFKGVPVPGRFWPTSVVEQLRGPQMELNKIESQVAENAQRIGNPALMCSRQANIVYKGTPGERIDFDDTVQNAVPQYLIPPMMPQYVLQEREKIERSIQEISGQHEVSNAQVPAGVKAASAINLLQEADDTRLGPAIYDMEESLGLAGSKLLKLIAQYWTEERTIMIAGEDHAWDVMLFRGAALKENTHVEVQSGSAFPKSKAAQQAAIQDMVNLRLQYGEPPDPILMQKVMKDMEAGGLERLFGDLTASVAQVNRENQQISQGQQIPVNPYDEHQVHIHVHEEFQRSATYPLLGPEVAQMMEAHVAEHRERLLASIAPPGGMQPAMGGGGGAPSSNGQPQPQGAASGPSQNQS